MNDLITKSFLSYVELKKQAMKDLESEEDHDIEKGEFWFSPADEQNLSVFFQQAETFQTQMEAIAGLLMDLQNLNEEAKSTHSSKILRGLRDRMESNIVAITRRANAVKTGLQTLEIVNMANRKVSQDFKEGSCVDRTRTSITNGLRARLRDMMNDFRLLRERIFADYREDLKRKYFLATGEEPSSEAIDKMISGCGGSVSAFEVNSEMDSKMKERHEVVNEIKRSLNRLHQVFLDMAVLVETQGDKMDDIEANVATAGSFVSGGTNSLYYANQMKKEKKTWVFWIWMVMFIILVVCIISMLASR